MTYETLLVTVADKVATVTLNRPDLRNAFNEQAIAELARVFDELGRNDGVRAIVLAANGPSFCAGADLNWMKKMAGYSHDENEADAMRLAEMLRTIYLCPKPVVARVQGDCYAGGMGLVAACDIVVASEAAGFCLSEVKLGLIPATISPYVIKAMGEQAARRYFLTAERFDAAEAQRIGCRARRRGAGSARRHRRRHRQGAGEQQPARRPAGQDAGARDRRPAGRRCAAA